MGENSHGRKIPIPRRLDYQESAASLRLWKTHFTNYTRTDQFFAKFVQADTKWKVREADWGFAAEPETSQTKRTGAQMQADCLMFLETLSSYLPDDYLVEKITKNSEDLASVWTIVDDFYGVTLNSETFLGLAKMSKKDTETNRQFYLRMEGFVSKHLTKGGVKVEEIQTPVRGDIMTISIKNIIMIIWMSKVHPKLIDCVKIDFAQELRAGRELIELMGRVADNVDSILARHDVSGTVSRIEAEDEADGYQHGALGVNKVDYGQRNVPRGRGGRDNRSESKPFRRDQKPLGPGKVLKCSHCDYLGQTLRLKINSNHESSECWRKNIAIRLMAKQPPGHSQSGGVRYSETIICYV